MNARSPKSPNRDNFKTPLWESQEKVPFECKSGGETQRHKNQPHEVSLAFGTPFGVGTCHGHLDTQDSPRPGLGVSHHLPPYSILCSSAPRLHPNGTNSRDSQVGVPKLSRNRPGTLGGHIFSPWPPIATRSEPKL
jgi:hypothetical protein